MARAQLGTRGLSWSAILARAACKSQMEVRSLASPTVGSAIIRVALWWSMVQIRHGITAAFSLSVIISRAASLSITVARCRSLVISAALTAILARRAL